MHASDYGGFTDMQLVLIVFLAVLIVVQLIYLIRALSKRGKGSRYRAPMADRAFNSILAAEKIYDYMLSQGIVSDEARLLLKDARKEQAMGRYDSASAKADSAKNILAETKRKADDVRSAPQQAMKPAVPLEDLPVDSIDNVPEEGMPEPLKTKVPDNYMQSKFIISSTGDAIREAEAGGKDVSNAKAELEKAKKLFESSEYTKALSKALRAKKLLHGEPLSPSADEGDGPVVTDISGIAQPSEGDDERAAPKKKKETAPPIDEALECPGCGTAISPDDKFCRKCGEKIEFATVCPGCSTEVTPEDAFCRKCGQKLR